MKPRLMHRREVIALDLPTLPGKVVYLAKKLRWDAAWYTEDINEAKVFRHPGLSKSYILAMGESWKKLNPRIVDPRKVEGYVDVPTRAAKRQVEQQRKDAELEARLRGKTK